MSTITTKQLRSDMAQIVRDLRQGRSVQLSYRRRIIGILQPVDEPATALRRGSVSAVRQFLRTAAFSPIPKNLQTSSMTFKQEIANLRDRDVASQ